MSNALDVLVLVDLASPPPENQDYTSDLKSDDWRTEANVLKALGTLGHEPRLVAIHNDIAPLLDAVKQKRPDVVFNLCEAFRGDRQFESSTVGLLQLLNLPYTGASLDSLALCKDKSLTKKILTYHGIRVPRHVVSYKSRPLRSLKSFKFPAFIKPLGLDASEGISKDSFADNEDDCLARVRYLHEKLGVDAIIEEFIDGRELYVGIMGKERLIAFPPRELFFKDVEDNNIKVATYKAKWDEAYRAKYGIKTGKAQGLDSATEKKILDTCKKIYRLLGMDGYGRIDLRLQNDGEPVFLEANPNPSLASDDDFARGASYKGIDYVDLIKRILTDARVL